MAYNVQISIREDLLSQVDQVTKKLGKTRSSLIADALKRYLNALEVRSLEERHIQGYRKKPVQTDEFGDWTREQKWPET